MNANVWECSDETNIFNEFPSTSTQTLFLQNDELNYTKKVFLFIGINTKTTANIS